MRKVQTLQDILDKMPTDGPDEDTHLDADRLLLDALRIVASNAHEPNKSVLLAIVAKFEELPKWYA